VGLENGCSQYEYQGAHEEFHFFFDKESTHKRFSTYLELDEIMVKEVLQEINVNTTRLEGRVDIGSGETQIRKSASGLIGLTQQGLMRLIE
jgi:hypothetical protein